MQGSFARPRWVERLELAGVVVFAGLWAATAWGVSVSVPGPDLAAALVIGVPLGWMGADLLSGIVHWIADEFFEEDTPVLGALLIQAFREHHRDPLAIARRGVLEVSGYNSIACVLALVLIALLPAPATLGGACLHVFLLAGTLGVAATNQFHKWAHAAHVPRGVDCLQRCGLILSPSSHAHHHHRRDTAYCVTTGWLNRPLDELGVFQALTRWARAAAPALLSSPAVRPDSTRCGSETSDDAGRRSGSR